MPDGSVLFMAAGKGKRELRVVIPERSYKLLKAIAGLKNGGRDWNLSDCVSDALDKWFAEEEHVRLISENKRVKEIADSD